MEVDMKEVKAAAKELNTLKLATKKVKLVGLTNADFINDFLKTVETIPEEKEVEIPRGVANMYNKLVEQLKEPTKEEVKEECPVFMKGWDVDNKDCQGCEEQYPDDYKKCKEACKVVEEKPKKKKATAKKSSVEKTAWGHVVGKQAGDIDTLIIEGQSTLAEIAEKLSIKVSRVKSHTYHLTKKKGVEISIDADGKVSGKKAA